MYKEGDIAKEMFIIYKGDCKVYRKDTYDNNNEEDLGRRGPSSVLGEYIGNGEAYHTPVSYIITNIKIIFLLIYLIYLHYIIRIKQITYNETVIATTFVQAFVFNKYMFYNGRMDSHILPLMLEGLKVVEGNKAMAEIW